MSEHAAVSATLRWTIEGGPLTLSQIAALTHLPRRHVEQAVQSLRLEGAPIVSTGDGLFWSTDPAEVKRCADRLRRRAIRQMETAQALGETAEGMVEPTLWGAA